MTRLLLVLTVSLAACGSSTSPPGATIRTFTFTPARLEVAAGDTVTWTNLDDTNHTVTGASFDSGPLGKDDAFEHAFSKAGTFPYRCSIHETMRGAVVAREEG